MEGVTNDVCAAPEVGAWLVKEGLRLLKIQGVHQEVQGLQQNSALSSGGQPLGRRDAPGWAASRVVPRAAGMCQGAALLARHLLTIDPHLEGLSHIKGVLAGQVGADAVQQHCKRLQPDGVWGLTMLCLHP